MIRVYLSENPIHNRVLQAFYDGCTDEKQLVKDWQYKHSDIAVIFGVYKSKVPTSYPRGEIFRQQRQKNLDVIVLETGYVNRGDGEHHHYAAGFNGLNGRADFRNQGVMPSDRWTLLGKTLQPYTPGTHIILCGQVPWDASVEGTQHLKWIAGIAANLQKITNKPIVYRPHPLAPQPPIEGCERPMRFIEDDLQRAHAVVCWNSNTGVDAAIAGKPVFAFDEGSMVWDICSRGLLSIDTPAKPQRQMWANALAYAQWTPEEMAKGLAWKHLVG